MSRVFAFGPLAERYAQSPSSGPDLLFVDSDGAAAALSDAFARRSTGEPFEVRLLLPTQRAVILERIGAVLLAQFPAYDGRRQAFSEAFAGILRVNGSPLAAHAPLPATVLQAMRDTVLLSDGLVVGSESERRRVSAMLGRSFQARYVSLFEPGLIHEYVEGERDLVLIWGAHGSTDTAQIFAVALEELHVAVAIVDNTSAPDALASLLRRARVIVDTTSTCADTALALCGLGATLVTNAESGAHETLERCVTYTDGDFFSIAPAVLAALGMLPTEKPVVRRTMLEATRPRLASPLVSLIVPTRNRRHLLPIALESIARQVYENIEMLVVNDAGEAVDDIVGAFPNARLLNLETNVGIARACNLAFNASAGEFVGLLADDDILFPDHVDRLVHAALQANASVVHGDVVSVFLRPGKGRLEAHGFMCDMTNAMDLTELLITNRFGATSVLFRREALAADPMDEAIPLNRDYLLWLRLALRFDFVHVPYPTSCYTIRPHEVQMAHVERHKHADAFRFIYTEHPVVGRPELERRRAARIAQLELEPTDLPAAPPLEAPAIPWPPWRSLRFPQQR